MYNLGVSAAGVLLKKFISSRAVGKREYLVIIRDNFVGPA